MNYYIVTNGTQYIALRKGSPNIVKEKSKAKLFETEQKAENFIKCIPREMRALFDDPFIIGVPDNMRRKFKPCERKSIFDKTNGKCALCGNLLKYDYFSVDHIKPLDKDGTNDMNNLQPTCYECNSLKSNFIMEELNNKMLEILTYQTKYNRSITKQMMLIILRVSLKSAVNRIKFY